MYILAPNNDNRLENNKYVYNVCIKPIGFFTQSLYASAII